VRTAPYLGLLLVAALPVWAAGERVVPGRLASGEIVLPNGRLLTPTGVQTPVLSSPFALAVTPDGGRVVVASTGPADQALQVLDARDGRVLSSTPVEKAWLGLAIAPDGRRVYLSGANSHRILTFRLEGDHLTRDADLPVERADEKNASALPAGIALSPDGKSLWVARILSDDLVSIDLATRAVTKTVAVGRHP
jgi:YVTN family beta-propeller protein